MLGIQPPPPLQTTVIHISEHPDLQGVAGWRCWHAGGRCVPPSPPSAGPPVSNTASSAPRSPSCAAISRCEGRRSIHQPGCLFPPRPPSLACPGWRLTASGNFGSWCRTSSRQGARISRNYGKNPNVTTLLFNRVCGRLELSCNGLWESGAFAYQRFLLPVLSRVLSGDIGNTVYILKKWSEIPKDRLNKNLVEFADNNLILFFKSASGELNGVLLW